MPPKRPADGRGTRAVRVGIAAFAAAIAIPASALAVLPPEERQSIERLYIEGQDRYAEGDFVGAAERWTELLGALPENEANRATRESVLINIILAYLDAYRRVRTDAGERDIEHLHAAQRIVDDYLVQFRESYGDAVALSSAVQEKTDELAASLRNHQAEVAPCLQPWPCLSPCLDPLPPPATRRGCSDKNDVALLGLLALPGVVRRRRREILAQVSSRLPADVVKRLEANLDREPDENDE